MELLPGLLTHRRDHRSSVSLPPVALTFVVTIVVEVWSRELLSPAREEQMNRRRGSTLIAAAVIALGAGGSVLLARSSDDTPAAATAEAAAATASAGAPPVRVVVPGRPGESAVVTDSDKVKAPDGSTYNLIDRTFVQMMIAHHRQAIEMADLAPTRAADPELRALADRISAAQKPEIDVLRAWLADRRLPENDAGHDHTTMPGMQSPDEIAALSAARGADFDRRFVTMMTAHHEGARQMAGDVIRGGSDQLLSEMANEMSVEQGSEIRRMKQLGIR
jgi:uncharacterized protein (DUF305 family)